MIRRTLQPPALDVFVDFQQDGTHPRTWNEVLKALDDQFQSTEARYQAQAHLHTIRQKGEHLITYKNRLVNMARLAYDDIKATQIANDLIHIFCKGLRNSEIAMRILSDPPADLEEAVTRAMHHQSCYDLVKPQKGQLAFAKSENIGLEEKVQQLSEQIETLKVSLVSINETKNNLRQRSPTPHSSRHIPNDKNKSQSQSERVSSVHPRDGRDQSYSRSREYSRQPRYDYDRDYDHYRRSPSRDYYRPGNRDYSRQRRSPSRDRYRQHERYYDRYSQHDQDHDRHRRSPSRDHSRQHALENGRYSRYDRSMSRDRNFYRDNRYQNSYRHYDRSPSRPRYDRASERSPPARDSRDDYSNKRHERQHHTHDRSSSQERHVNQEN